MAWFRDYDRDFSERGRGRGGFLGRGRDFDRDWRGDTGWTPGYAHRTSFGADRGRGARNRYAEGYDYLGRNYGYDRDYRRYGSEYMRRSPEESPTYGRGGDRAVQRWASRYGYDMQYQVSPDRGRTTGRGMQEGQGRFGGRPRGWGGGRGGFGRTDQW